MKLLLMIALLVVLTYQALKTKKPGYCFWCGWSVYAAANLIEENLQ